MKTFTFPATSNGTRWTYPIDEMLASAKEYEGKTAEFTIKPFTKKRSLKQNNSIFGIAYTIISKAWSKAWEEVITVEYVHEQMKMRFRDILIEYALVPYQLKELKNKETGEIEVEYFPKLSTTNLTTVGGMKYYKALQKFSAEWFGEDVPDPNEKDFKNN